MGQLHQRKVGADDLRKQRADRGQRVASPPPPSLTGKTQHVTLSTCMEEPDARRPV